MASIGRYIFLVLSLGFFSGCAYFNAPHLYGNDSCKDKNKTAYVYPNGKAAVCLNESSVAYMLCARDLAIIADDKKDSLSGSINVPVSGAQSQFGVSATEDSKVDYATEGELANARAEAIRTCIKIYETYK